MLSLTHDVMLLVVGEVPLQGEGTLEVAHLVWGRVSKQQAACKVHEGFGTLKLLLMSKRKL